MAQAGKAAWDTVTLAPVVLIKSKEEALADRAWERLLAEARAKDPDVEVVRIDPASYEPGQLAMLASPSLFGGAKIAHATGLENMSDEFQSDVLDLIKNPSPDLYLVAVRNSGGRGVKLFTAAAQAKVPVVTVEEVSKNPEKFALLRADARRAGRTVTEDGLRILVDSLGNNVREMLAGLQQLFVDIEGTIGETDVKKYFGNRVEARGYQIADAAVGGNLGSALQLLRHGLSAGSPEVMIVGALAKKFRELGEVSATMGKNGSNVKLKLQPWQIRNIRNDLRSWSDAGLAAAITAIAQADSDVKGFRGEAKDPAYAVEKCLREIVRARRL